MTQDPQPFPVWHFPEDPQSVTVRQLAELLARIPDEYQDDLVYATYDGNCSARIYMFDPATIGATAGELKAIKLPGD